MELGLSNSPPSTLNPWKIQVWREGRGIFVHREFNIHGEGAVFYTRFRGAFSHKINVPNHFYLKSRSQTLCQLPLPSCSGKTPSPQPLGEAELCASCAEVHQVYQSSSVTHTFLSPLRKQSTTLCKRTFVGVLHSLSVLTVSREGEKNTPGLKN